jgi:hypothetical protein
MRVLVEKNDSVRTIALEKRKGGVWRDQTSHLWTLDGKELVAAR